MGYYTYYTMEARGIKDQAEYNSIVDAMKDQHLLYDRDYNDYGIFNDSKYYEASHSAYFEAYDESKWYDHTYDMVKFSKLFPNVTFKLHGEGEESGDLWNEYYHNGAAEECRARIVYDMPCEIEWDE